MAFNVDRTYFGGQLAYGEGVTLVCNVPLGLVENQGGNCFNLHWEGELRAEEDSLVRLH